MQEVQSESVEVLVTVKWYSRRRGYGFVVVDKKDAPDIFVSHRTLKRCKISTLQPNQALVATVHKTEKGLRALSLATL